MHLTDNKYKGIFISMVIAMSLLYSCTTISKFDQYAYTQSTSLKVDVLALMDKATSDFSTNETAINALNLNLDKTYNYALNQPKNIIVTEMWRTMIDSNGNQFGGFIKFWRVNTRCSKAYIDQAKIVIGQNMDRISQLESKKIKE